MAQFVSVSSLPLLFACPSLRLSASPQNLKLNKYIYFLWSPRKVSVVHQISECVRSAWTLPVREMSEEMIDRGLLPRSRAFVFSSVANVQMPVPSFRQKSTTFTDRKNSLYCTCLRVSLCGEHNSHKPRKRRPAHFKVRSVRLHLARLVEKQRKAQERAPPAVLSLHTKGHNKRDN